MIMRNGPVFQMQTGSRTASLGAFTRGVLASAVIAMSMLLGAMLDSRPAVAQAACRDRAEILKNLEKDHSEAPRAMGLSADGTVLEVLVSPAGTWTILVSYPSRLTCPVAAGEYWESVPMVVSGPRV